MRIVLHDLSQLLTTRQRKWANWRVSILITMATHVVAVACACAILLGVPLPSQAQERAPAGLWIELARTGQGATGRGSRQAVIWTGREMLVWGGTADSGIIAGGARYDPPTDSWAPLPPFEQVAFLDRTAIWTGREMLIWGGSRGAGLRDDGGRNDPTTDSWRPISSAAAIITARGDHTAVWTGREMLAWGGVGQAGSLGDGARYDPSTDTWTSIALQGAPDSRNDHSAVWTGHHMIVWGGSSFLRSSGTGSVLRDGGLYDPRADSWIPVPTEGAPSARRSHAAVWTGREMLVWGGTQGRNEPFTGASYRPYS